eukprot:scaffold2572_cov18-Tisochrysis_lutea.AAC.4
MSCLFFGMRFLGILRVPLEEEAMGMDRKAGGDQEGKLVDPKGDTKVRTREEEKSKLNVLNCDTCGGWGGCCVWEAASAEPNGKAIHQFVRVLLVCPKRTSTITSCHHAQILMKGLCSWDSKTAGTNCYAYGSDQKGLAGRFLEQLLQDVSGVVPHGSNDMIRFLGSNPVTAKGTLCKTGGRGGFVCTVISQYQPRMDVGCKGREGYDAADHSILAQQWQ